MEQAGEIMQLRNDVRNLKEMVENLTTLVNKGLLTELQEEVRNIESGESLTEEEFAKKHKVTFKVA